MPNWKQIFSPIRRMLLSGLLLGLSAPGFGLWPLAWVALIPALQACQTQPRAKHRFGYGFSVGAVFAGLYYLWFFDLHPLAWLGFGEVESRLITLAGWLLLLTETATLFGLLFMAYGQLKPGWQRIVLFPLLWVLAFSLLNLTPMALPWAQLEYTQASAWPLRFMASILSGSGLTGLMVLHNCFWAEEQPIDKVYRRAFKQNEPVYKLIDTLVFPLVIGLIALQPEQRWEHRPWPIPVAVIQGNLPIETIRSGALNRETIERSYIQPLRNVDWPAGTLLVYPEEGVVPGWTPVQIPYKNRMMFELMELARQRGLYIAVGVSSKDPQGQKHNSLAIITPDERVLPEESVQFYHKRRLVPFGEFTPYGLGGALTKMLASLNVDYTTPYDAGINSPLLQAGKAKVGGLICFELIDSAPGFGGFARQYQQQGANLLINSSNLGWFHQNPLLEAQFLAIGQLRAAETGLPLVISSNTGISAIISGQGQILQQTHPNRENEAKSQVIFYNGK